MNNHKIQLYDDCSVTAGCTIRSAERNLAKSAFSLLVPEIPSMELPLTLPTICAMLLDRRPLVVALMDCLR